MDVLLTMNCRMDKQFCAFESAIGSSAQTLVPSPKESHWETVCNSRERRTICDASPESSSSVEASSAGLGVVTGWVISSARDSRGGVTRGLLGEETHRLSPGFYRIGGRLLDVQCGVPFTAPWVYMDREMCGIARRREVNPTKASVSF